FSRGFQPTTQCVLVEARPMTVKFSRAESPTETIDPTEVSAEKVHLLLPLACALASPSATDPIAPLITWSTVLLPFNGVSAYGLPFLPSRWKFDVDITPAVASIEDWCRLVDSSHARTIDVAAR